VLMTIKRDIFFHARLPSSSKNVFHRQLTPTAGVALSYIHSERSPAPDGRGRSEESRFENRILTRFLVVPPCGTPRKDSPREFFITLVATPIGVAADITIFDPKCEWTYRAAEGRSKSHNSPFDGWKFTGRATVTIVGGRIVYRT